MTDVRIVLERHGSLWHWTMTCGGNEHIGQSAEQTAGVAAEAAENYRRQLELHAYFKKKRGEQLQSRSQ